MIEKRKVNPCQVNKEMPVNQNLDVEAKIRIESLIKKVKDNFFKEKLNSEGEEKKLTCKEDFKDSIIDFLQFMAPGEYHYSLKVLNYFFKKEFHYSKNFKYFTVDNDLKIKGYTELNLIIQDAKKFTNVITHKNIVKMKIKVFEPNDYVVSKFDPRIFGIVKYSDPSNMYRFSFITDVTEKAPYYTFRVPFDYIKLTSKEAITNHLNELLTESKKKQNE